MTNYGNNCLFITTYYNAAQNVEAFTEAQKDWVEGTKGPEIQVPCLTVENLQVQKEKTVLKASQLANGQAWIEDSF